MSLTTHSATLDSSSYVSFLHLTNRSVSPNWLLLVKLLALHLVSERIKCVETIYNIR